MTAYKPMQLELAPISKFLDSFIYSSKKTAAFLNLSCSNFQEPHVLSLLCLNVCSYSEEFGKRRANVFFAWKKVSKEVG